ncbi:hypothetical protein WDW89_07870 [Deltaproteobacteria bacterium TL4]
MKLGLMDEMKSNLDLAEKELDEGEKLEIEEATDIIKRHQREWQSLRDDIVPRKKALSEEVQKIHQMLELKKEELHQLKIEYEKRKTQLEEKHIHELKKMEAKQQATRQQEDDKMGQTLDQILEDLENSREKRGVAQELHTKREEMERKLQEEMEKLRQQKLAEMEVQIQQEEERLRKVSNVKIDNSDLLTDPSLQTQNVEEVLEENQSEEPQVQTYVSAKPHPEPVVKQSPTLLEEVLEPEYEEEEEEEEEENDGELNCSWDGSIFSLHIEKPALDAGSYSIVETLKDFFSENEVKEFHVDLALVETLNSQVIELVLKLVSTFRTTTTVKLENARENFLATFQMLGLDKNVPIQTIPGVNKNLKADANLDEGWDL